MNLKTTGIALALIASSSLMAKMERVSQFGSNPGNLTMYKSVPTQLGQKAPLVLALHGCTQTAAEFEARSGWSQLAEEKGFVVVYPEQNSSNNPMMCFNWGGEYGDQTNLIRGEGENQSVFEMIETIKKQHDIDEDRIFIVGFSAGAAMTSNMLALYPDIFKAGAIMAGIPYRCATDLISSFTCMFQGKTQSAQQWGSLARSAFEWKGKYPKLSIWHGTSDFTVTPKNADELVKQFGNLLNVTGDATSIDLEDGNEHTVYRDDSGEKVISVHKIIGMGHAITVDPSSEFEGGSTGSFSENKGIHSTYEVAKEWDLL